MEPTIEPVVQSVDGTKNSLGGKVAIIIIMVALISGAFYFFTTRQNNLDKNMEQKESTANEISTELDGTDVDVSADMNDIDTTLSN